MSAPWQTVAKVDSSTFLPGDSILFQRGAQFHEELQINSSGSPTALITFGAYGNTALADPEFFGSDVLDATAFTLVSGTTYSTPSTTAVTWVYDNHQFTRESLDELTNAGTPSTDPATNITYVEGNSETFFYDTTTSTLYLNLGSAPSGHVITATTRPIEIFADRTSYLLFDDLYVTESAADANTYAISAQGPSTNVEFLNCTATLTGKHAFGALDSTKFVAMNLSTNLTAPELGFGGASAYVAYSDSADVGDSSTWINCSYTNPNGPYPVFVTHGDPGSIGSILLQNVVCDGTYGNGLFCESTGTNEVITVDGGQFGSSGSINTNNSVVNGVTFDQPDAGIELSGNNDVLQNCVFDNLSPNVTAGNNGGAIITGMDDVVRFNTFSFTGGPAVDIMSATSNVDVYANIFDCTQAILLYFTGNGNQTSDDNLYGLTATNGLFTGLSAATYTLTQWQAMGYDAHSIVADPEFVDSASGNYQLTDTSPAVDFYTGIPDTSITPISTDFAGNARPFGSGYDAGAFELQSPKVVGVPATLSGPSTVDEPAVGTTTLTFTVTLGSASASPLTVDYLTHDGTALAGTDYVAATGTLSFAAGVTSQTFTVQITPDVANQSDTMFTVALSNPSTGLGLAVSSVPVAITNLAVVPVSISGPATVDEPVSGTVSAIYTVSLAQASTASSTVDYATVAGTGVAGSDFSAVSGTLTFAAGQTSQTITVPILADDAVQTDTTFSVALSSGAGVTVSPTASTVSTTITNAPVTIEQLNSHHQYKYSDASGVPVTIQLSGPGQASIVFAASAGTGENASQVVVTGTTAASSLSIIARTFSTVGDILVTGSLRSLSAPKVNLAGRIAVSGTVASVNVASLAGGNDVQIAGSTVPVALSLGSVTNATLESASVIRSLTVSQWVASGGLANSVTAPAIAHIGCRGSFAANLDVSGAVTSANFGAITAGAWEIGSANAITVASVAPGWTAAFTGTLRSFTTLTNFEGSLSAAALTSFNVHGSLNSATVDVPNLGRLNVIGAIASSSISATDILALAAASISGSTVLAGVSSPATLPVSVLGSGLIGSFTIRGVGGFASTTVATATIKAVSLRAVISSNGGTSFGFDAHSYGTFSVAPRFHWNSREPLTTLTGASTGDFDVIAG